MRNRDREQLVAGAWGYAALGEHEKAGKTKEVTDPDSALVQHAVGRASAYL